MKSITTVCVTFIVISALLVLVDSQVLGIDFGTEFWKASLISPGKNLAIVENSRSERKTHNSIAFHDGIRFFESETVAKRLRKPQNSHFYLNRLIRSLDNDEPVKDYPFENGTYIIRQDDNDMTLEQVVAMILRNLKSHASKQAGSDIKDCVIAIPANWGPKAKMCLINAAYMADMSVLGLTNQNSAAMINFAITRNDSDPINMVVFNLGSANLQISVFKLFGFYDQVKDKNIQSIEALGHHVVDDVGGLTVDQHISNHLAEEFKKKHNVDPRDNPRSWVKLLHKSSDAKEVLSANKETTVYVEGLMNGIDMQQTLKREVVEGIQMFKEFPSYIEQALEKAGVQKQDITFVQLIGGASRIPRVANIVKDYFAPAEVGAHMNGDEAMAFGAALRAANLSIALKVKQLHIYDKNNFDTRVVISSAESGVIHEEVIFDKDEQHGSKKSVIIGKNDEDLKISLYQNEDVLIREYATSGVADWIAKYQNETKIGQPSVVINFVSSSISIAQIKEVYVNVTLNVSETKEVVDYVEQEVQVPDQETEKTQKNEQNQEGQKEQQQQNEAKEGEQNDKQQQQASTKKTKKEKQTKTVKKQVQEFREVSKKNKVILEETFVKYPKYTSEYVEQKREIIKKFEQHEQELKDKARVRNELESTLYAIKDNFEGEYMKKFSKEDQLDKLKKAVTEKIDWLEENAWTASKTEFQSHFKSLYGTYHPIYNRTMEYQDREKYYNQTMGILSSAYLKTEQLNQTNEWLGEKITDQLKKINTTVETINEKIRKTMDGALNQDPAIYNQDMLNQAERTRDQYYLLRMIPRPKKVKETPKAEASKDRVDETVDLDNDSYPEDYEGAEGNDGQPENYEGDEGNEQSGDQYDNKKDRQNEENQKDYEDL